MGEALRGQARQMFHGWHRVRDGTLTHASLRTYMQPIRQEVERLREAGQACGVPKTAGTCRELVLALDADAAGQQQWRALAREVALRGKRIGNSKRVAVLPPAAYGGDVDHFG